MNYSQNSINTYKSCPLKYKYKYIDRINWRQDDIGSREYYESLKIGSEFHLLCERYFSKIPIGIDENMSTKFVKWLNKIERLLPIERITEDKEYYLPEYEIRYKLNNSILTAKYDLLVIKEDSIEIWDWKTESKKVDYKSAQNRVQTMVYMFLAKEVIPNLYNKNISYENISMKYYQPEFEDYPVKITYSKDLHNSYKNKIQEYINLIEIGSLNIKNENHCKFCEFNKLCNNKEIKYEALEEELDEC